MKRKFKPIKGARVNIGHVTGGTHAGWRKTKQAHEPWECECLDGTVQLNPGYRNRCACGSPRPN